jgi:tRNA(adenine34) deaminase
MGQKKPSYGPPAARDRPLQRDKRKPSDEPHQRDEDLMRDIVRFTARTLDTPAPVPFGALIAETATGNVLLRARNAVQPELDPSSHAELRAVRKAARKLGRISLAGYTLYTTCEPCPMCMANALWAGLDRVVYGATIDDANRSCRQIHISAREVSARSDMPTVVEGPLLREECNALFDHPNMQRAFATWNPRGLWVPSAAKPIFAGSAHA